MWGLPSSHEVLISGPRRTKRFMGKALKGGKRRSGGKRIYGKGLFCLGEESAKYLSFLMGR